MDTAGTVLGFNDTFAESSGRDPEHLVGASVLDMALDHERPFLRHALAATTRGERWGGILSSSRPDGSRHWEAVDFVPTAPTAGVTPSVLRLGSPLGTIISLRELEGRQEDQVEFWLWEPDTDTTHATIGLSTIWEIEPGEQVNQSDTIARILEPDRTRMLAGIERALSSTEPVVITLRFRRRGPGLRKVELTCQRVVRPAGRMALLGETRVLGDLPDEGDHAS